MPGRIRFFADFFCSGRFGLLNQRFPDHAGYDIMEFFHVLQHLFHAAVTVCRKELQPFFQNTVYFRGRAFLFMEQQRIIGRNQMIQIHQFPVFRKGFSGQNLIPEDGYGVKIRPWTDFFFFMEQYLGSHISRFPEIILVLKYFSLFHGIGAVKVQKKNSHRKGFFLLRRQQKNIVGTDIQVEKLVTVKRNQRPKQISDKKYGVRKSGKLFPPANNSEST